MAVDERELGEEAVAPRARTTPVRIPTYRYTSAEFAAREMEQLWPRVWQLACSVDHVANPGDYYEHRIGRYSVLIVRGDDGELRAFQNVCLHRGAALCEGSGTASELRCPYHRWAWDLAGRLREVPSRREFGVLNDEMPLIAASVGTWGPMVFVNMDPDAEPLDEFLDPVPSDSAWARLDEFRGTAIVSIPAECNWKTLIDAFSETYHVQGIHREMLGMTDDVNGPQGVWRRHGKLEQPYGLPSPRLRDRPDDQGVWESFIEVMGARIGIAEKGDAGEVPPLPQGGLRALLASRIRDVASGKGLDFSGFDDAQILDMKQYNLFPNITVLVFADMLTVVRSRPGTTHLDAFMDVFAFDRRPVGDRSPRTKPFDVVLPPDADPPIGLVLSQDVANFARSQRGLHQPGLTHITVSPIEECRLVNLHRNLEQYLRITPSEVEGMEGIQTFEGHGFEGQGGG